MALNQELFAFWEYDQFPYCLGGKVNEIKKNGRVEVEGYPGMSFKPIVILPFLEGEKIKEQLEEQANLYKEKRKQLHEEYLEKVQNILPQLRE